MWIESQFENVKQLTTREITINDLERINQYVRNKGWTPLANSVSKVPNGTHVGLWISNDKAKNIEVFSLTDDVGFLAHYSV